EGLGNERGGGVEGFARIRAGRDWRNELRLPAARGGVFAAAPARREGQSSSSTGERWPALFERRDIFQLPSVPIGSADSDRRRATMSSEKELITERLILRGWRREDREP